MAAIFQTTFSIAFSWIKMYEFWIRFHWNSFLSVKLMIFQHLFRYWLGADQATSHYLNQWWLAYWRMYASLGLNELKFPAVKVTPSIVGVIGRFSHMITTISLSQVLTNTSRRLTHYMLNLIKETFIFYLFSTLRWCNCLKSFHVKTRYCLSYIIDTKAADALARLQYLHC